jgi:hypothetical protein
VLSGLLPSGGQGIVDIKAYFGCYGDMFHDIHTKFHKDWLRHLKVNKEGFTDNMHIA